MGTAFSSTPLKIVPDDAETQILFRCKYLTDEWDRIMKEVILPQRQEKRKAYAVPPLSFIPRMLADFPRYKGFAPTIPMFKMRIVDGVREKLVESSDNLHDTTNSHRWVQLSFEENQMMEEHEEYLAFVDGIRKQQAYSDGVHARPPIEIPTELAERVIDFYRVTYVERSDKMQELARTYLMNEWKRAAGV